MTDTQASTSEQLPDIGLVGAGKVGLVLTSALREAGHRITKVWDPFPSAIERAEQLFGKFDNPESVADVAVGSGLVVIAVPDDAIAGVVEDLATKPELWPGITVIHVSGRCGADVLRPLQKAGAVTAAVHPAMAFTGAITTEVERTRGARFAVTGGDAAGDDAGRDLVERIGAQPIAIAESDRPLYHAALAHSSNHLVTLVVQAAQMLHAVGVDDTSPVLTPILTAALDNALEKGPAGATGPVVRGDVGTVEAHLGALSRAVPGALASYQQMSLAGADIAFEAGRLPAESRDRLRTTLNKIAPTNI